jgi:flagellin
MEEVDRIANSAEFNNMKMLTGRFAVGKESMVFHVGANADQRMSANIGDLTAAGLAVKGNVNIETPDNANKTIGVIDQALTVVNKQRADLGAYQNRMEQTVQGLSIAAENMQAAESRIRDADVAQEMVNYVKNQILVRSGTSMLAQANLKPQTVLELLR